MTRAQFAGAWPYPPPRSPLHNCAAFAGFAVLVAGFTTTALRAPLGKVLSGGEMFCGQPHHRRWFLLLASLFRTRERPLQLGLGLSLPLFFLSGLTWPAQATPEPVVWLARIFPTPRPGARADESGSTRWAGSSAIFSGPILNLPGADKEFSAGLALRRWTSPPNVCRQHPRICKQG